MINWLILQSQRRWRRQWKDVDSVFDKIVYYRIKEKSMKNFQDGYYFIMGIICICILWKGISQDKPYLYLYSVKKKIFSGWALIAKCKMQNYFSGWALCGTNSAQATDLEQAMVSYYFGNNAIQTFFSSTNMTIIIRSKVKMIVFQDW